VNLFGGKTERVRAQREQAWACIRAKDFGRGREEFARLVALEPKSASAWFGYGWCAFAALSAENAATDEVAAVCVPLLSKALHLNLRSAELTDNQLAGAHYVLGLIAKLRGEAGPAADHLRAAIRTAPSSPVSLEPRNELAGLAAEDGDLETAERLLQEALQIDPQFDKASTNLAVVRRRRESFEIGFVARLLQPIRVFNRRVTVHPDDTLGEISDRVMAEEGLPPASGWFIFSGDDALPPSLDGGFRYRHQTVRELGLKERDEVHFQGASQALVTRDEVWMVDSAREALEKGYPAVAHRQVRWALDAIDRHHDDNRLEQAEGVAEAVLKFDPGNAEAQTRRDRVRAAIRARDAASACADANAWSHSHGGAARTSQAPHGPLPPLQRAWEFAPDAARLSAPVLCNGLVYLTSSGQRCYCLDGETGQGRWEWSAPVPTSLGQPPALAAGNVYVSGREGLYSLDAKTGQLRWRYSGAALNHPTIHHDKVFVADAAGTLRCLHAKNGQKLGKLATGERDFHSIAVDGEHVIALSNRMVLCANPNLDRVLWKREGRFDDAVPVLAHGSIYLGTFAEGLWCLEAASGRCRWLFATEAWVRAAPAVGKGRVFFGDSGGRFGCLDAQTGELLWTPKEWVAERVGCAAAPVMAGPLVYVLCNDGVLACLDALGGGEVWRGTVSPPPGGVASLAITAHAVYCTTPQGKLICVADAALAKQAPKLGGPLKQPPKHSSTAPLEEIDHSQNEQLQIRDYGRPSSLSAREHDELIRAVSCSLKKRDEEAIAILRRLQRDHPNEELVLLNLASAYEGEGLVGDALATFDHVLELNPGEAHAFAGVGRLLRKHPDMIEELFGRPKPFRQPPDLSGHPDRGLAITTALVEEHAVLLCQADAQLAANFALAPAWYWWQYFETASYPVLRFYLEFDYQPYRFHELLLPLDVAHPQTAEWLNRLSDADYLTVHVYDNTRKYSFTRNLAQAAEYRTRLRALRERALGALKTLPAAQSDYQAAIRDIEASDVAQQRNASPN